MQVTALMKGRCAPSLASSSCAAPRRRSNASSLVVVARAFDIPKSDKFVPKRNPGAGDPRKLGSSDLLVSCEWIETSGKA